MPGNVLCGNFEALPCNHCCSGKAISITHSEGVFLALSVQLAMRMHCIVICDVPCSTIFSTISKKRHDFRKKILKIKCVFRVFLQHLSEIFFNLGRSGRDMIKNVNWSSSKVPCFLVRF